MTAERLIAETYDPIELDPEALLQALADGVRAIHSGHDPETMIHATLRAIKTLASTSSVRFDSRNYHDPPTHIADERSARQQSPSWLNFLVPSTNPVATISIDRGHLPAPGEPVRIAIETLVSTLGTNLARIRDVSAPTPFEPIAAGNELATALLSLTDFDEARRFAVQWLTARFDADYCSLVDEQFDRADLPGARPKMDVWTRDRAQSEWPIPGDDREDESIVARIDACDDFPTELRVGRSMSKGQWTDADRSLFAHLATVLERGLRRARMHQRNANRARQMETVNGIIASASAATDLTDLSGLIHNSVKELIPHDVFLIALQLPGDDHVTVIYRAEGAAIYPARTAIPQITRLMQLSHSAIITDINERAELPDSRFGNSRKRVRSVVSSRLLSEGTTIGLIVAQSYLPHAFSWHHVDLLESVATSTVGAFERLMILSQINKQTRRDAGLRSVAERLATTLDTEELIDVAADVVFGTVESDHVVVSIIDRQASRVRSFSWRGSDPRYEPPADDDGVGTESLTFAALQSMSQVVVSDYVDSSYSTCEESSWWHFGSVAVTPIAIDQHRSGIIAIGRIEPNAFATDDLSLLRQIAAMLSTALLNTTTYAERLRHVNDLQELQHLSSTIAAQLDLQKSLDEIVSAASRLVEADSCGVGMLDGTDFVQVAGIGEIAMSVPKRIPISGLLMQGALANGKPIVIDDLQAAALPEGATHLPLHLTRGWMAMPLIDRDGEPIGIISVLTQAPRIWTERDRSMLAALAGSAVLAIQNARHFERTRDLLRASVESLAAAVEAKDPFTQDHSRKVGDYARRIAEELGLDSETVDRIELAGLLHDVGKIGIPDSVLQKPGPLDGAEWAAMQLHPVIGEQILSGNPILQPMLEMVRHHHERWDGHGYPDRLSGEQIPIGAAAISLAEVLDTMTADRPYRRAFSWEETLEEIRAASGTQFSPEVVEAFSRVVNKGMFADAQRPVSLDRDDTRQERRSQPLDVRALRIFDEVAREIRAGADLNTFVTTVVATLQEVLDVPFITLYVRDEASGRMELTASLPPRSYPPELLESIDKGDGIVGWVAAHGTLQNIQDVSQDDRYLGGYLPDVKSELCVPLAAEGEVIGVLNLESDRPAAFSEIDEHLLESTADRLASAIHVVMLHDRLKQLATTDALTGLDNHRAFFDRLVTEIDVAARSETRLTIAILDVDNLKAVNDTYGHLVGDAALRSVADILNHHCLRQGHIPCRYGGDEFVIILPNTSHEEAWTLLDAISSDLYDGEFEVDDITLPLPTGSWGTATCPDDGNRPTELLSVADERMYLHKPGARL